MKQHWKRSQKDGGLNLYRGDTLIACIVPQQGSAKYPYVGWCAYVGSSPFESLSHAKGVLEQWAEDFEALAETPEEWHRMMTSVAH